MSGNVASAKRNGTDPSTPTESAVPTGYRVSVVPGALEISARLGTPEEIRNLVKVLRAGIIILEETTDGDMDEPLSLTKRVAAVGAVPQVTVTARPQDNPREEIQPSAARRLAPFV